MSLCSWIHELIIFYYTVENALNFPYWFTVNIFHVDVAVYSFLKSVIFCIDVGKKLLFPFALWSTFQHILCHCMKRWYERWYSRAWRNEPYLQHLCRGQGYWHQCAKHLVKGSFYSYWGILFFFVWVFIVSVRIVTSFQHWLFLMEVSSNLPNPACISIQTCSSVLCWKMACSHLPTAA